MNQTSEQFMGSKDINNTLKKLRKRSLNPTVVTESVLQGSLSELIAVENIVHSRSLKIQDFQITVIETERASDCQCRLFEYLVFKYSFSNICDSNNKSYLPGLKVFSSQMDNPTTTRSSFCYLGC